MKKSLIVVIVAICTFMISSRAMAQSTAAILEGIGIVTDDVLYD